jgi:predicted DNA-binding transcriptional regulator AlpA
MVSETALRIGFAGSAPAIALGAPDDLLTALAVKNILGGVSEMTLWRWSRDRGFPKPDLVIGRRKYWRRATVQGWISVQATRRIERRTTEGGSDIRLERSPIAGQAGAQIALTGICILGGLAS